MKKRLKKILILAVFPIVLFLTLGIVSFGAIFGNVVAAPQNGGAIIVGSGSTLNTKNGFVSGFSAAYGGGVYVNAGGTFNLSGGSIYNNSATIKGNNIYNSGTFTMTGGRVGKQGFDRYDETGNPSSSGQYVYFGSYPKTIKANNVTINTSNVDSNGYFLGSDNQRYAKFTATPIEDNYKFTNGETIVSDRDYYFKVEPILWRILSEKDGKAIIFAKDIIEASIFYGDYNNRTINDRTIYPSNYQYSYIRTFINGDFYNKAFSLSEKNKIITTAVNNRTSAANDVGSEYLSADTEDNVWLLSYTDLSNTDYGFDQSLENASNTRIKRTTDYSLAGGVLADVDDQLGYTGLWWSRSPSGNESVLELFLDGIGDIRGVGDILGVVPALTISLKGGGDADNYGIYNIGTMNLYGGNVYDNIYSSANVKTKMACNIAGTITLGDSATITVQDYAETTPNYTINLSNTRTAGTILTFVGSSTEPDLTKLNISGYNSEECRLSVAKNSSGNWTVSLVNIAIDFPKNWKTEVASSTYMTTTITPANITKIQFIAIVPSGYTKIGTLSTGLSVYQGTTATEIAFVCEKIYAPKDSGYLFNELKKVTSFKFDTFNTSKATNMYAAFRFGESLQSLDLSNFNTSKVTNMGNMFYSCKSLTSLNVSNFNTSNVTNMDSMFGNCLSLTSLNISSFNTTNVTNMSAMFQSCNALTNIDVSNFNTSKVANMDHMFYNCLSLTSLNLSNFNTSNVTDMSYMFQAFLADSALTSLDVSNFDTSKVTNMGQMFSGLNALTSLDVSNFDTSNVTNMWLMFQECKVLTNIDVSNFNTSNVTNMSAMFQGCNALTSLNVSSFNTSKVTSMSYMFSSCSGLTSLNVSNFNTSNVTDMNNMFSYCKALISLDVSCFDTSNVTNMEGMFEYCNALTSLDVSNFDTSNVTNMRNMFSCCDKLTSLNLSNFNTSNVTDMFAMFQNSKALTNIDLSNFNTSKVTNMSYMFSYCSELISLNLSSFDMTNVGTYNSMLNFESSSAIGLINTPYNNSQEIKIGDGSFVFYVEETGEIASSVSANSSRSYTYTLSKYLLPKDWQTQVASTSYMTTTVTPRNLTSIKFVSSVPSGYTKIGTLSTGLPVYQGTTATEIAFVERNIIAPADSSSLFRRMTNLRAVDFSHFKTGNVTNMSFMFDSCSTLTSLNLKSFDTSKVTNMSQMFGGCKALTSLNLESFDTSKVTNMSFMFYSCFELTSIDVSGFNTANVTNMSGMFDVCDLTSLDLSGFNTANVTDMSRMFQSCHELTSLDLSGFDTSKVTDMRYMFYKCASLTSLNLSSFDMTKVTSSSDMLNFGSTNKIKTFKTPYNYKFSAIRITTASTLYNVETGAVVTSVPEGTTRSLTYSSTRPSSFVSNNKIYKFETCFAEIETSIENEFDEAVNESKNCFVLNNKKKFQFQIVKVEG